MPVLSMAAKYKTVYESEFAKLSDSMKRRVLEVKTNNSLKDVEVNAFIKDVIAKAEESEAEPIKKQ